MKSFFLSLLLVFSTCSLFGQAEKGYQSLFNGKNLKGWTSSKENPDSYSVKDGVLIVKGGRSHLFYTGKVGDANFKNFEYKLKAKTTKGSNSGVYFHTKYQEEGWPEIGFEAQVNSTHYDPKKTGSLYGVVNIYAPGEDKKEYVARVTKNQEVSIYKPAAPSKDGEWFEYHITVKDNKITIRVNGEVQTEWEQPDNWEREGRKIGSGTMAFQAHDPKSEVHFKDIRIKILD